ncbi:MAG: cytochrome C oxidase subunit IV family protein [Phycisphaerales bacterium]|nr:cytochrome C oxidase subunit IV family protein [Phycisphaerales bacterium]
MAASAEDVRKSIKSYLLVFGALAVLTVITVAASWLKVSVALAIFIALVIASVKGSLVASVFMHLTGEKATLYWVLIISAFFFFLLILLPVLQTWETSHLIDQVKP